LTRLKGFEKLMNVDEALRRFLTETKITLLGKETVTLSEGYNRVLASDIKAEIDIPPFDRSAMDGYAVKAENTFGASIYSPKKLKIVEEELLGGFEAKKVWTGNPIPEGADAVIELERTRILDGEIEVLSQVTPGRNVSKKGEDVKKGEVAVKAGRKERSRLRLGFDLDLTT